MLKNLSYRQKLKYAGLLAIVILFLCYKISFSKTVEQYNTYRHYQAASLGNTSDLNSLQLLQAKNNSLDEILGRFVLDTLDQGKNLLGIVSSFCDENDLRVKEYKPNPPVQRDSLQILTRTITVEGSFIACLKLVNHLETQSAPGRVSAVQFKTYSNAARSETFLNCTIFIQNIITANNERK